LAPQAPGTGAKPTGPSNTRLDLKKNTKNGIVFNFKKSPQKIGQVADEILGRYSKNIPKKNRTGGSSIDIF
jgi:hypothetical protein